MRTGRNDDSGENYNVRINYYRIINLCARRYDPTDCSIWVGVSGGWNNLTGHRSESVTLDCRV